jgi:hypothetical protein
MSPPLLSVEGLDVSYDGAVQALRDVSRALGSCGGAVDAIAPAGLKLLDTIEGPSAKSYTFG